MTPQTRLQQLQELRQRIDLEIERETRYLARCKRLLGDVRTSVATREEWAARNKRLDSDTRAVARTAGEWTAAVIAAAAQYHGVSADDVRGLLRTREAVDARHVAAWLLREAGRSYPQIGAALNRDHSTAINSVRQVEARSDLMAVAVRIHGELTGEGVAA